MPAETFRDEWGIPHLRADSADELAFLQGFNAAIRPFLADRNGTVALGRQDSRACWEPTGSNGTALRGGRGSTTPRDAVSQTWTPPPGAGARPTSTA